MAYKNPEDEKRYRQTHKEESRLRCLRWRDSDREHYRGWCRDNYQKNKDKILARDHRYYHNNREEINFRRHDRHLEERILLMFALFPPETEFHQLKCIRCGFDDVRVLQFDHINGGGNKDAKRFSCSSDMTRWYLNHLEEAKIKLQVLCPTCNFLKRVEKLEYSLPKHSKMDAVT